MVVFYIDWNMVRIPMKHCNPWRAEFRVNNKSMYLNFSNLNSEIAQLVNPPSHNTMAYQSYGLT